MYTQIRNLRLVTTALTPILALIFSSCTTGDWVTTKISGVMDAHSNNLMSQMDDKMSEAKNFYDKHIRSHTPEALRQKILEYKRLNLQVETLLIKCAQTGKEFIVAMEDMENTTKSLSVSNDKKNFIEARLAALAIVDYQVREWHNYSWETYELSAANYNGFFERASLYQLAVSPIHEKKYQPLGIKTLGFLNQSKSAISDKREKIIAEANDLVDNFSKQELLYCLTALYNCRKLGEELDGEIKLSLEPWNDEARFLENDNQQIFLVRPELNRAKQTLLINRAYVCDVIIRKMSLSQEYPLEVAYFIVQLGRIKSLQEPELFTTNAVSRIMSKYVSNFNSRSPMSGPEIKRIRKFKQETKNVYQNP